MMNKFTKMGIICFIIAGLAMVMLPLSVIPAYNLADNTVVSNESALRQLDQIKLITNILINISWILPILGTSLIIFGVSKKKSTKKSTKKSE